MSDRTIFLFAGQGSQFFGMGRTLHADSAIFREELQALDDAARRLLGRSVLDVVLDDHKKLTEPFDDTRFSHPAIFMFEVALARTLIREGVVPDMVMGASLGELACLAVAGVVPPEVALRACIEQAELLAARCSDGGMLAIVDSPRLYDDHAWLHGQSTLAAVNFDRHFVVSGQAARCDAIEQRCNAAGVPYQRLPVRVAFHSPAIDGARDAFLRQVGGIALAPPRIPIISATGAGTMAAASPETFWDVIRRPIRFRDTLEATAHLLPCTFIDLSPGGTLSTFLKHHHGPGAGYTSFSVFSPFRTDTSSVAKILEHVRHR